METLIAGGSPKGGGDVIKDTDTRSFGADVIEESRNQPVIVDFWAPWCGPCKQLGPLLERLVRDAGGKVKLVKLNVDENQQLAQQFRIQSIPAVYAFHDAQPVDGFVGSLPESQLKQFVDRLIELAGAGAPPSPVDQMLDMAREALAQDDARQAAGLFARVMQEEPANVAAVAGLARCAVILGDVAKARELLDTLPAEADADAEVQAARAAIDLAEQAAGAGDLGELEDRIAANPADHQARFDLAIGLYAGGDPAAAIEHLLEIVKRDRAWNEDAARLQLFKIFDALGPKHELTAKGRRGLSSVLFS
jgi:putative thioredoxin